MTKNYDNSIKTLNECKNKKNTVLNLSDGKISVNAKLTHEFGGIWGMAVKFTDSKSYGKMYERTEDYVINYLAQFDIK